MTGFQIPRNSLAWLLAAQAGVVAPHVFNMRLPLFIVGLCVVCGFWRVMVYQGRWSYPGRWVKIPSVIAAVVGVGWGYSNFLGLDPWVGLLICAFMLKLLEMHSKRDAYIVILLGYFVALTEFLYNQSIPYTAYMFLVVITITAALIGLNQTRTHSKPIATFRLSSMLLLQSVPLMVVLFVLFPRLAPLWTVPLQSTTARTGVTDEMTPGNIAQLTQSDELAFRVTFEGDVPPNSQLYWRAMVLSEFDGQTWRQYNPMRLVHLGAKKGSEKPAWFNRVERYGDETTYSVIQEPTNQHWLVSLTVPEALDASGVSLLPEYQFHSLRRITKTLRYEVTSNLSYVVDRALRRDFRNHNLMLPLSGNDRSKQLAREMRQQSGSERQFVNDVLRMFNEQEFVYTLKPDLLGEDAIDEFLLETKRGFCEHYAGSFVFMMRAAGVPARVVVGYQGGEYNRIGNYVEVRQFDAHAWTEVWLDDMGWFRVDPTSAVAPERIEQGLESALEGEEFLSDITLSWLKYRQTLWITEIRLQLSAIAHYWDSWVVGYNPDVQMSVLTRYLGDLDRKRIGMIMLGTFFGLLAIIGVVVLRKRAVRPLSGVDQEFLRFCRMMEKQGLGRGVGEGPLDYARRIGDTRPELSEAAHAVTEVYVQQNYVSDTIDDTEALRKAVRAFRVRLLAAN